MWGWTQVLVGLRILMLKQNICHYVKIRLLSMLTFFSFFSIWTCCVASDKWTCWPSALRVIEKLDGMQSYPTLRIQTNYMFPCLLNILHRQSFHSLHTNLVFVSTCLRSTITLLFFPSLSCQSPLFCPSITFSYNLLLLSPPSIIS